MPSQSHDCNHLRAEKLSVCPDCNENLYPGGGRRTYKPEEARHFSIAGVQALLAERDELREAARKVLSAHMAGLDMGPSLNRLEDVAGFRDMGGT